MATRFIHMGLPLEQSPYANVAPFAVDDAGQLKVVRGAANKGNGLSADPGEEIINIARVIKPSASFTLEPKDSGALVIADSTTSVVATLPATEKGLTFTLVVGQLTASGGHAFSPNASDKIMGNGFTAADDKDAICTAASDRVGDAITLVGDGVDGWYITAVTGTWAREA